jgi:hypothetical protein
MSDLGRELRAAVLVGALENELRSDPVNNG